MLNHRSVFVNSGAIPSFGRAPFASACTPAGTGSVNFDLRALISCRRFATASERSSDAVTLTSGIFRATSWSKLTSTFVTMRSAVASITAPMIRWTSGAAPGRPDAVEDTPAAEAEREQHGRRPDRVRERHRDRPTGRRAHRDDRGEDRPGARGVDEAERGADEQAGGEPVAPGARPVPRQAGERRLEARGDAREQQRDPEPGEHDDREHAQRVRAEPDAADDLGDPDDRDRERDRQAEDDAERPPSAARAGGREHRREHRQDARAEGRAGTGEEGEPEQEEHARTGR